jgi:hypothetical protein
MNALTKNRILEKGDEYKDKDGTWKPVPEAHLGLQVMFSPCQECRRPSEPEVILRETPETARPTEAPERVVSPTPISQPQQGVRSNQAAEAESDNSPVPSHSGAGGHSASYLPTVVSHKAHAKAAPKHVKVVYTDLSSKPNWIGRNGTFGQRAVNLYRTENDLIQIIPEGMRGEAKNALIEVPVADLSMVIEFLEGHCK